jgi:hypothetical protein
MEIGSRQVELQRELSAVREQLTSAERSGESESISRRVEVLLLQARKQRLENELEIAAARAAESVDPGGAAEGKAGFAVPSD